MPQIQISIIMPAYNVSDYIGASIESVLQQTGPSWELLIVDDHSTDGTKELAEQYAILDSRIRVFTNEGTKGAGGARNTALRHMLGETCFFLDGDDILLPGALKTLYDLIKKSGTPTVLGRVTLFCEQRWTFYSVRSSAQEGSIEHQSASYPTYSFCSHLYDTDFIKKNSIIFPEHLPIAQDSAFICHAYSLLDTVSIIHREIFIYRINHKQAKPSGIKSISAINYFLLAREYFDKAGKHELVAPYLKCKFSPQWLERTHAALADNRDTALLFMEKCRELLHDMENEVRPFLDMQLGKTSDEFWKCCQTGDTSGMLTCLENSGLLKPQQPYIGIQCIPNGPRWWWYLFSRRLAHLIFKRKNIKALLYLRSLRKKSVKRLSYRNT